MDIPKYKPIHPYILFYSRLKASLENKGKKGGRKKKSKRTKKDKNGDIIEVSGSEDEEDDDESEYSFLVKSGKTQYISYYCVSCLRKLVQFKKKYD